LTDIKDFNNKIKYSIPIWSTGRYICTNFITMKFFISLCFSIIIASSSLAQGDQYKVVSVGFYNLENLFDYTQDTTIRDYDFIPDGDKAWTKEKYAEKLENMAYVISQIGIDVAPAGLSVLGVEEIENKGVLEDLVKQESIKDRNYKIIHFDSPDRRGIDVGLLYNPSHFNPVSIDKIPYPQVDADTIYTRDILHVKGLLDGDSVSFVVNHWPSRYGGEERSRPRRNRAAKRVRNLVDSLYSLNPDAKIIIGGDLNDDPTNESLVGFLKAKPKLKSIREGDLYNPMHDMHRRGLGSNAYRDSWSLFDQIVISEPLLDKEQDGYFFYKANIFNKKFLIQRSGKYRGYPFRTFSFDKYQGGYSDHFPVYTFLVKKI